MEAFHKIGSAIAAALIAAAGLFGGSAQAPVAQAPSVQLGASNAIETPVALFSTSLANSISASATSMTLVSALTKDGTTLASSTYSFVIDEGTASEEFVIADCTGTSCTNMQRGLSVLTGTTSVAALQQVHRRGASVKITDAPVLLKLTRIINGISTLPNTISYTTHPTFTATTQVVDKKYVDDTAFSGAGVINATASARGVVELATPAESAASAANGSSGPLVPANTTATSTYNSATAANRIIVTGTGGVIDPNFIDGTGNYALTGAVTYKGVPLVPTDLFGTGTDGNVTISAGATTTLSRDMHYNNLTVNGGLVTNGFRVFVKGTIAGASSGYVDGSGAAGNDGAIGVGGATSTQICTFFCNAPGSAGQSGSTGNSLGASLAGQSYSFVYGSTTGALGGKGGDTGASGASAGAPGTASITYSVGKFAFNTLNNYEVGTSTLNSGSTLFHIFPAAGSSGGGGAAGNTGIGGGSGSGGSSGLPVFISANIWSGTFHIQSLGGKGGNGANGSGGGSSGGGGGGGGGNGGSPITIYGTKTWTGSYNITGGVGGTHGAHSGSPGTDGTDGAAGSIGVIYEIPYTSL